MTAIKATIAKCKTSRFARISWYVHAWVVLTTLPLSTGCNEPITDVAMQTRIAALVHDINKNPDLLHSDYTPAVHSLIDIGEPALKYGVLELLMDEDIDTRMRAQRVVEGVVIQSYGFAFGQGWADKQGEEQFLDLWKRNDDYRWDMDQDKRQKSYELWKQWSS